MMKHRTFVCLFVLTVVRAQDVAPPPKPGDSGPSLEATMKFIQDKLNEQGEVNYTVRRTGQSDSPAPAVRKMKSRFNFQTARAQALAQRSGGPHRESEEVSAVAADPRTCQVSLQERDLATMIPLSQYRFSFRDAEKLMVMPLIDALNRAAADRGEPQDVEEVIPDISALLIQFKGKKVHKQFGKIASDEQVLRLVFKEDEMAQRMAKAMVHAIELCGGGNKDPF